MTFRFGLISPESPSSRVPARPRFRRLTCAALLGSLLVLAPRAARAQDGIELGWEAPAGCPQEAAVRERLRALRGQPLQKTGRLRADGRIEHVEGRYRLTLTVHEGDAVRQRTMEADSCSDLAGAAAVALGLLIRNESATTENGASGTGATDERGSSSAASGSETGANGENTDDRSNSAKDAAASAAAAKPNPPKPSPEHTDTERTPEPNAPDSDSEPRRWHILLRAPIGVLALGRLAKPSGGVGAGLGFEYDAWRVGVTGRVFASQTMASNDAYETSVRVGSAELDLAACRDFRSGSVAFAPCFGAALQRETARGSGPGVTPESTTALSGLVLGGAEIEWFAADWLALFSGVALGIETSRPNLQIAAAGDVKKLGPVEVSFSVGSQWIF